MDVLAPALVEVNVHLVVRLTLTIDPGNDVETNVVLDRPFKALENVADARLGDVGEHEWKLNGRRSHDEVLTTRKANHNQF